MEDKKIENENGKPTLSKKIYSPPELTAYGKLTELTAGGTEKGGEAAGGKMN